MIAATNRIDILDPALLRSGRIDRKIEFPLPTETARAEILEIHSRKMTTSPDVNFEELARSTDEFNGAQLKAVCVEAGMIALREGATKLNHEHFLSGIAEGMCIVLRHCYFFTELVFSAKQEEERLDVLCLGWMLLLYRLAVIHMLMKLHFNKTKVMARQDIHKCYIHACSHPKQRKNGI